MARMYTAGVRERLNVTRNAGKVDEEGRGLSGACDVEASVEREELPEQGSVIDRPLLRARLRDALGALEGCDLDAHPAFEGKKSTPELVARWIHRELGRTLPVAPGMALTIEIASASGGWVRYRAPLRGHTIPPT